MDGARNAEVILYKTQIKLAVLKLLITQVTSVIDLYRLQHEMASDKKIVLKVRAEKKKRAEPGDH